MHCILLLVLALVPPAIGGVDLNSIPFTAQPATQQTAQQTTQQTAAPPTCATDGSLRELRLTAIREEILAKLHFPQAPSNPRRSVRVSKSVLSAYDAAVQTADKRGRRPDCVEGRDSLFAQQLRLYFPSSYQRVIPPAEMFEWGAVESTPEKRAVDASVYQDYVPPTSYRLSFELNLIYSNTSIWSSDLRLYKKKKDFEKLEVKQENSGQTIEKVEVYYISHKKGDDGKYTLNHILVTSKDVGVENDGYESFDVTQAVRHWIREGLPGDMELEVVIRCPQSLVTGLAFLPNIEFVLSDLETKNVTTSTQLVIAILKEQEIQNRKRRQNSVNTRYCFNHPEETNCCVRELEIDFKRDFGWTWIIAPLRYSPNFCQGLCPSFWPSASTSTSLLIRYREMNPNAAVVPCCATATLKPLTLLLVVNGRILLEELSDMIVESCVCR